MRRERAGAAARARLGRLRRPLREPDAGSRPLGRGGRPRGRAALHARPSDSLLQGGVGRARGVARGAAGRPLHRAQPGRAGLRRARGCARRVRPGRRWRAAGVALGHDSAPARPRPPRACVRRRAVPRRRRAVRVRRPPPSRGRRHRATTRSSARSVPASSGRDLGSATARSRSPTPPTRRPRSAAGPSSPSVPLRPTRANVTTASPTTRTRCSSSHSAMSICRPSRTGRGGRRPAPACRSRTWAAGETKIPCSSAPPMPQASRPRPARLMEERRLGPVVGLGTWNTFRGDAALAGELVGAASTPAVAASTPRRCTAPSRRSAPRSRTRATATVLTKIWTPSPDEARAATRRSARLVRPGRGRADPQPRRLGAAPALARGRARRWPDREARRHPLLALGVRRACAGAPHRPLPDAPDPAQPARAHRRA